MNFKRFFVLLLSAIVLLSCKKEEIDYSQPAALYRDGDPSFVVAPLQSQLDCLRDRYNCYIVFDPTVFGADPNEIIVYGFSVREEQDFSEGNVIDVYDVYFTRLVQELGHTRTCEGGEMRYMGKVKGEGWCEWDGLFRFEDVRFSMTRGDGSGIVDKYRIRGTMRLGLNNFKKMI